MNEKIIVVTGAGKGIDKALAIGLSRERYTVIASGRNKLQLQQLSQGLTGNFLIEPCDIGNWDNCQRIV